MRCYSRAAIALAGLSLIACAPIKDNHGYVPRAEQIETIEIGRDDQAAVAAKIGRPVSVGVFNESSWVYLNRQTEQVAIFAPKVIEQTALVVSFDDSGVVDGVNRYGIEDGKVINLVTRTTPTRGKELTFLQQILGNVGRYNPVGGQSSATPGSQVPGQ